MSNKPMYRQGDILLIAVDDTPKDYVRRATKRAVLGYGEVTGHTHTLANVEWLVAPETTDEDLEQFALGAKRIPVFIVASQPTTLTHQEHAAIDVPVGSYRVIRQRIYTPQAIRSVMD